MSNQPHDPQIPEASGIDRRQATRHPISQGAACALLATLLDPLEPAMIRNISTTGIGLAVGRWFEPDTVLDLELLNPVKKLVRKVRVRVAYMMEDRSGEWRVLGGAFLKQLHEDELRALLA